MAAWRNSAANSPSAVMIPSAIRTARASCVEVVRGGNVLSAKGMKASNSCLVMTPSPYFPPSISFGNKPPPTPPSHDGTEGAGRSADRFADSHWAADGFRRSFRPGPASIRWAIEERRVETAGRLRAPYRGAPDDASGYIRPRARQRRSTACGVYGDRSSSTDIPSMSP
jgi:hypothetical protein